MEWFVYYMIEALPRSLLTSFPLVFLYVLVLENDLLSLLDPLAKPFRSLTFYNLSFVAYFRIIFLEP